MNKITVLQSGIWARLALFGAFFQLATSAAAFSIDIKPSELLKRAMDRSQESGEQRIEPFGQKAEAPVSKVDYSVPLSQYQELGKGEQLMFLYLALSKMPVDYNKTAFILSNDYRQVRDEFKKKDLLQALSAGVDGEIESARQTTYRYMDVGDKIDKYDFGAKAFPLPSFAQPQLRFFRATETYWYLMYENPHHRLVFSNSKDFSEIPVPDEGTARAIESLRVSRGAQIKLRIYFVATGTRLGHTTVTGEITKIRIIGPRGAVLAER
jgi:hypothetical protein